MQTNFIQLQSACAIMNGAMLSIMTLQEEISNHELTLMIFFFFFFFLV